CRGSARPIYVEALDSYIMFMTISGEDGETLTFKYYDVNTGETYAIADEFTFSVNATVGDVMNPYVMTRGAMGIDELSSSISIYPNPVDNELFLATEVRVEEIAIYDVYGRTTTVYGLQTTDFVHSIDVADLDAGVYFVNIKTENGNVVKRFIKK
ncbi:MAG: T9SS type A sorting domain-containing protein, partial [Bacteroidales bacterium]|nr:T9SS type A sorting domain-containing protein [Bacteroidales bacterium]